MAPSRVDLAKIHIAKKELHLTDEVYRDILRNFTGKESAAKITPGQAWKVLAHFKTLGWKPKQQGSLPWGSQGDTSKQKTGDLPIPADGQSRKILALWIEMHKGGIVKNGSNRALLAYVKRVTKKEHLKFCDAQDKSMVIEALKTWWKRVDDEEQNEQLHNHLERKAK